MQMIVPDMLSPSGFVLLANQDSITAIDGFHGQSNFSSKRVNLSPDLIWQIVNILKMLIGNQKHMSLIIWEAASGHKSSDCFIFMDDIRLLQLVVIAFDILH